MQTRRVVAALAAAISSAVLATGDEVEVGHIYPIQCEVKNTEGGTWSRHPPLMAVSGKVNSVYFDQEHQQFMLGGEPNTESQQGLQLIKNTLKYVESPHGLFGGYSDNAILQLRGAMGVTSEVGRSTEELKHLRLQKGLPNYATFNSQSAKKLLRVRLSQKLTRADHFRLTKLEPVKPGQENTAQKHFAGVWQQVIQSGNFNKKNVAQLHKAGVKVVVMDFDATFMKSHCANGCWANKNEDQVPTAASIALLSALNSYGSIPFWIGSHQWTGAEGKCGCLSAPTLTDRDNPKVVKAAVKLEGKDEKVMGPDGKTTVPSKATVPLELHWPTTWLAADAYDTFTNCEETGDFMQIGRGLQGPALVATVMARSGLKLKTPVKMLSFLPDKVQKEIPVEEDMYGQTKTFHLQEIMRVTNKKGAPITPGNILLIDDNENNVKEAVRHGFLGVHVKGREGFKIDVSTAVAIDGRF